MPGGAGNSNSGNLTRDAFGSPRAFANILGVPVDLVYDFNVLLVALNCGDELIADEFQALCDSWLDRFHSSSISWNILLPTMHLILYHGADILRALPLAPALFGEDGSEGLNKVNRYDQAHHARQFDEGQNLLDVFL